mmetsp:Transcript_22038/g.36409  ORF Transcript_22038/g.36409 Transcript_22038/m.36409 type:complete len:848 (-) Transcript_22038:305-2848(-)
MPLTSRLVRLTPREYVHVLDNNRSITRVEVGPQSFTLMDHEEIVLGPANLVTVPQGSYCVVLNPVVIGDDGQPQHDEHGQIKLKHGVREVRLARDPFPLYAGEDLVGSVKPLEVITPNEALHLKALHDFEQQVDDITILRQAGNEWMFEGPGTFIPRAEIERVAIVKSTVLMPNQALRLRAKREFVDRWGISRKTGQDWLVREEQLAATSAKSSKKPKGRTKGGAYIPAVEEEVCGIVKAYVLTDKRALHLRALQSFKDVYGATRKAGQEWLVTVNSADSHIPDVCEELVGQVEVTTLTNRQYCIVQDPIDSNKIPQMGTQQIRTNTSFFLHPGEMLVGGVKSVYVLTEQEALLLSANEAFRAEDGTSRQAGERWMLCGPCDYIPPIEVNVVEKREAIPLDKNEGIYVRDTKTGRVRSVIGETYMLKPSEVLWEKTLPAVAEQLLGRNKADRTRLVTYPVPHNSAVQIYNYQSRVSRVVFGPELAMLEPEEQFTILSLSGGKPKKPHQIKAVRLALGPDFSTDIVTVETLDHARLELQLSYNWQFEVDVHSQEESAKLFAVPDFVGDICKLIGSKVRSAVAATTFDHFHRESARIIRSSVFGLDESGKVLPKLSIASNNCTIFNIDIQAIEPVDQSTRDSLQKSVYMAIEITTKSQEAAARHEGQRNDQMSRGRLERQRIVDEVSAERDRSALLQLQAESAAVESSGQAAAEARARAEASKIEAQAALKQAELKAEAARIEFEAEQQQLQLRREAEIKHTSELNALEIAKAEELAEIEAAKFKELVSALTPETIKAMSTAGPETQAQLLQGLGLKGFVVTDGNSPINLFNTANGMINLPGMQGTPPQ